MLSVAQYKNWLEQVTLQIDIDDLKRFQICPENLSQDDKYGDL